MNKWNPATSANCGCCIIPERETIEHLFLRGEIVDKVLTQYCGRAGIIDKRLNLMRSLRLWRNHEGNSRLKVVFKVVPILMLWFMWKRRNNVLHGGKYQEMKVF